MIAISATCANDIRNRRNDIYIMDDDGHNMRCLTVMCHLLTYRRLHWLMNNRAILFASYAPSEQYYVIDIERMIVQPFMGMNEWIVQITSDQKVFFSTPGHDWVVPVNGTLDDCVELVVDGMLVAVSPDGQWIAFYRQETPGYVYIQNLHTVQAQWILMSDPANDHDADSRTVVWSPDSRYLAYQADYADLWVMRADGTQRRKVGELEYFWISFRWSPDSTSIAFISWVPAEQGGGPDVAAAPLYVTSIDHPAPRYLATLHKRDHSGGVWDWMPDSQHIVYATHQDDVANLYKINIRTHTQQLLTDPEHPFAAIYDVAVSS